MTITFLMTRLLAIQGISREFGILSPINHGPEDVKGKISVGQRILTINPCSNEKVNVTNFITLKTPDIASDRWIMI